MTAAANLLLFITTCSWQQTWYRYELWHPIDHVQNTVRVVPSASHLLVPGMKALIHERYTHMPAHYSGNTTYETDSWFDVVRPLENLAARRLLVTLSVAGVPVFQLLHMFRDTPQGCVIELEAIVGVPAKGWDTLYPDDGHAPDEGRRINAQLVEPMLKPYKESGVWETAIGCVSRHIMEEFGNYGFFVQALYDNPTYNPLGRLPLNLVDMLAQLPLPSLGRRLLHDHALTT